VSDARAPALAAECERLRAALQAIDNIAHDTPCMSLQASHEFERNSAAEAHRVASNHVLLAIRREARAALNQ
jgi:hypothetical protein